MSAQGLAAYRQMRAVSRETGWPEFFRTDMTKHDLSRLRRKDAPPQFGWVLRECGTELLDPRMRAANLAGFLRHYRQDGARCLFHWWDGAKLHSLSFEHFSVILREHSEPSGVDRHNHY